MVGARLGSLRDGRAGSCACSGSVGLGRHRRRRESSRGSSPDADGRRQAAGSILQSSSCSSCFAGADLRLVSRRGLAHVDDAALVRADRRRRPVVHRRRRSSTPPRPPPARRLPRARRGAVPHVVRRHRRVPRARRGNRNASGRARPGSTRSSCAAASRRSPAPCSSPPSRSNFPEGGVPLLVALIYPLLDLALALVVVGQWALAARSWNRRTVGLIAGFVAARRRRLEPRPQPLDSARTRFTNVARRSCGAPPSCSSSVAPVTPRPPQVSMARRTARRLPHRRRSSSAIVLLLLAPAGRARLGDRDPGCHHPPGHRRSARGGPARVAGGGRGLPARPDRRSDRPAQPPGRPARRSTTESPRSGRWA